MNPKNVGFNSDNGNKWLNPIRMWSGSVTLSSTCIFLIV